MREKDERISCVITEKESFMYVVSHTSTFSSDYFYVSFFHNKMKVVKDINKIGSVKVRVRSRFVESLIDFPFSSKIYFSSIPVSSKKNEL